MSENVGEKIAGGIEKAWHWLVGATKEVLDLATKVKLILQREKQLQPNFIVAVTTVVADVTELTTAAEAAVTADGLNFAIDSEAYKALQKLINDVRTQLVPVVDAGIAAIK